MLHGPKWLGRAEREVDHCMERGRRVTLKLELDHPDLLWYNVNVISAWG
jgi:hypothetical protein